MVLTVRRHGLFLNAPLASGQLNWAVRDVSPMMHRGRRMRRLWESRDSQ